MKQEENQSKKYDVKYHPRPIRGEVCVKVE
jgi:hypothetical protein